MTYERVFVRGVTEHFHDGVLFLGGTLISSGSGGRDRLLWTESVGAGINWEGKERRKQWRGADNGTDGDRSGEQKGRDESYHCSEPGPC